MDDALDDLIEACRARPASAGLQRALLDAASEAGAGLVPAAVLDHFAASDPASHSDEHRLRVAAFLREGGRDDDAARWSPPEPEAPLTDLDEAEARGVVVRLFAPAPESAPAMFESATSDMTFADIGGLENVKDQIRRKIIAPFAKPGLFQAFRKRSGGGVLMYGPPGCGKTMMARATAGEAGAHFVSVAITDILDKFYGESERKLAQAFAQARARTPSVLFFDELEALAARRTGGGEMGAALVSTFLSEMDGFSGKSDGVLVLAATNMPWAVDSAFRRPGRFDRVLFVPPPDAPARRAILTGLLAGRPLAPGLDIGGYATGTSGFSGADLANLVETATELAIDDSSSATDLTPISRRHFDAAMREVRPTTGEWLAAARNYAKYANESGVYDDVLDFLKQHGR